MGANGRSCRTCDFAEIRFDEGMPIMECHLFPPMTIPDVAAFDSDGVAEAVLVDVVDAHRYPHVGMDDWCSKYEAEDST